MDQTTTRQTYLVFGATGQTGQHFTSLVLQEGHRVRALAGTPSKLASPHPDLDVHQGSVTELLDLDRVLVARWAIRLGIRGAVADWTCLRPGLSGRPRAPYSAP